MCAVSKTLVKRTFFFFLPTDRIHIYWCNSPLKHIKWLHWQLIPTFIVGHTVHLATQSSKVVFLPFPWKSDYVWLPASGCGHACVCQCSKLKMRRWVSGGLVLEWAGLMCSQQTASDPSSARLNWAPGFIQCGVYLQYSALYKSLLHRRPLRRGHCSSFIHTRTHTSTEHEHAQTHTHARTVAEQTCAEG